LHDGLCVGYLPQFAHKQPVIISVLQTGIVSFVVDQKVVFEFNIEMSSGTVGQLVVTCCGEGDTIIGLPITGTKELFDIELYQSPASSFNSPFAIIQRAMQRHFPSLSDRLQFASFAYRLSSILSSSIMKRSGNGLSLLQVSSTSFIFCTICCFVDPFFCRDLQIKWFLIFSALMVFPAYHAYLTKAVLFTLFESYAIGYLRISLCMKYLLAVSSILFSQVPLQLEFLHP
jgi:hypothetical protein